MKTLTRILWMSLGSALGALLVARLLARRRDLSGGPNQEIVLQEPRE